MGKWVCIAKQNSRRFDRGQVISIIDRWLVKATSTTPEHIRIADGTESQEYVLGRKGVEVASAIWVENDEAIAALEAAPSKSKIWTPQKTIHDAEHDGSGKGR